MKPCRSSSPSVSSSQTRLGARKDLGLTKPARGNAVTPRSRRRVRSLRGVPGSVRTTGDGPRARGSTHEARSRDRHGMAEADRLVARRVTPARRDSSAIRARRMRRTASAGTAGTRPTRPAARRYLGHARCRRSGRGVPVGRRLRPTQRGIAPGAIARTASDVAVAARSANHGPVPGVSRFSRMTERSVDPLDQVGHDYGP